MAAKPERAPVGPVGRFIACVLNGDAHPERVGFEVKRTWDKSGKERFSAACPICYTRCFLNRWTPELSMRTIVAAEAEGLYLIGLTEARRALLLKELGLRQVQPAAPPYGWPSQPWPVPWLPPPNGAPMPLPPVLQPAPAARRRPAAPVPAASAAPEIPNLQAPGRATPVAPAPTEITKEPTS